MSCLRSLLRMWIGIRLACAGLMIEHPLVQDHVRGIEGSMDGIMGLSQHAFMRVLLKTVEDSGLAAAPDKL